MTTTVAPVEKVSQVFSTGPDHPSWRRRLAPYGYVLPALIVVVAVMSYPFFYSIYLSFRATPSYTLATHWNGGANYVHLFADSVFVHSLLTTVIWTAVSTVLGLGLGLGSALLLNNVRYLKGLVRAALMLPYIVGYVIAAYAWEWLYQGEYGLINQVGISSGLLSGRVQFLSSTSLALPAVILANVWKTFPFAMIMLLAGLQGIPEQPVLAARLDRASHWRTFWEVKLPYVRPVLVITTMLLAFQNFNTFTMPFIMTGGGPLNETEIVSNYIYDTAFENLDFGLAAAGSVVVIGILMIFAIFYVRRLAGEGRASS